MSGCWTPGPRSGYTCPPPQCTPPLKGIDLAWAPDGRLVLFGYFPDEGLVATWRPNEPRLAMTPYDRPEATDPDAPVSTEFLATGG